MLDVGQGDAFLVAEPGDGRPRSTPATRTGCCARRSRGMRAYRLDAVVITHGDDDHKGSLASLAGVVDVRPRARRPGRALVRLRSVRLARRRRAQARGRRGSRRASAGRCASGGLLRLAGSVARAVLRRRGQRRQPVPCRRCGHRRRRRIRVACAFHREMPSATSCARSSTKGLWTPSTSTRWAITDPRTPSTTRRPPSFLLASRWSAQGRATATAIRRRIRSIGSRRAGARVFRTDEQGDVSCKLTADRIEVETLR